MWLLLAQFAKQKQRAAQAATGANPPHVELARPRIIPHPAGTIDFEHGQIVAKIGKRDPLSEWIISPALCVVHSTGDSVERTKSIRPTGQRFAVGTRRSNPSQIVSVADSACARKSPRETDWCWKGGE
jgi:hypothetical protein